MAKSFPDFHIHSEYCGHAVGSVEGMVVAAIERGVPEIGFSEHFPYPPGFNDLAGDSVVPMPQLSDFITDVQSARSQYKDQITIRLGVEVDFLPEYVNWTRSVLQEYQFDYIIGSVHILNGIPIDYTKEMCTALINQYENEDAFWQTYWQTVLSMLEEPWVDVVGHLDLPRKFLVRTFTNQDIESIDTILKSIRLKNLTLDINTAGWMKTTDKQLYPSPVILKRAAALDVDVMPGSDAHAPDQINRLFPQTMSLLKSLGFHQTVTFQSRQKRYLPL